MPTLPDLYPGFESRLIETSGARIHLRIGGQGPPLVLLHGFPQTGVEWHRVGIICIECGFRWNFYHPTHEADGLFWGQGGRN